MLGDASGTYTFSDSIQAGALNSLKLGLTPAIKILSGLPRFLDRPFQEAFEGLDEIIIGGSQGQRHVVPDQGHQLERE